jgi:hypothetical protein
MTKTEVQEIAEYVKELQAGLFDMTYVGIALEYPILYAKIELLMNETFKTKDKDLKVLLAYIELQARECLEYIKRKMGDC